MHRHGETDDHHVHASEDEHDHHGGHDHGRGLFGWLRHTFAHSHDAADKVDAAMATNERGI